MVVGLGAGGFRPKGIIMVFEAPGGGTLFCVTFHVIEVRHIHDQLGLGDDAGIVAVANGVECGLTVAGPIFGTGVEV